MAQTIQNGKSKTILHFSFQGILVVEKTRVRRAVGKKEAFVAVALNEDPSHD